MEYENLILKKEEGVATIRLNRPKSFNSFNFDLGSDLEKSLEDCGKDPAVKAVILTGEGKAFCAGGDIAYFKKYFDSDPSEPFRQIIKKLNIAIITIRRMPKPVIAAVNGAAGGAGFSLAAACDLRICAASAIFRQAYTSIGMVGDGGWTLFIPLLIGFGRAMELMLLDQVIDARQALEWGLVNRVVDDAMLESTANEIALKLSRGPAKAFAIAKENLNHAMMGLLERQLELERAAMVKAAGTSDYIEGVNAFLEKRAARFTGK
ncbi:MAG: enoyl-CoA hydratase/isomerase family protein [Syntrophales bacterium]